MVAENIVIFAISAASTYGCSRDRRTKLWFRKPFILISLTVIFI